MEEFNKKLREYAELIIRFGLNVQANQTVWLNCPAQCYEFAGLLAESAYGAGAGDFICNFNDLHLERLRYQYASDDCFENLESYKASQYRYKGDIRVAELHIIAPNHSGLEGVDPLRIQKEHQAHGKNKDFVSYSNLRISGNIQWSIAAWVSPEWAKNVFPDLDEDIAVQKLWDIVFEFALVTGDGTSIKKWENKIKIGLDRIKLLNEYNFKLLHFKNSLGTDLKVELPNNHYWSGFTLKTKNGISYSPNIPTEEIYTAPKKYGVNGIVYSSRPLISPVGVIEDFYLKLKNGKIIEAGAKKGQKILMALLDIDEGSRYLGEVALVPYDSKISQKNLLFWTTLFDENASCHLAFGKSVPAIKGHKALTIEEREEKGLNNSAAHYDFMIGTNDLEIKGIDRYGNEIPVFVEGNFSF